MSRKLRNRDRIIEKQRKKLISLELYLDLQQEVNFAEQEGGQAEI